ncbi:MAG: hypothetical protein K5697_01600 [Lachnospiraceae bacterium]|nr:hypothetical protein [Lachnospiraceae bacterium]
MDDVFRIKFEKPGLENRKEEKNGSGEKSAPVDKGYIETEEIRDYDRTEVLKKSGSDDVTEVLKKSGSDDVTEVLQKSGNADVTEVLKSGSDDKTELLPASKGSGRSETMILFEGAGEQAEASKKNDITERI